MVYYRSQNKLLFGITTLSVRLLRILSIVCVAMNASLVFAEKCLYVSSYHVGYEWNDGIERGIREALGQRCELDYFYLDTKRNTDTQYGHEMALQAKLHIEKTRPDIIIACDDNASKYLIQPYFKDSNIPVVFCGINWSVDAYGYPYKNATGMVEIIPIRPLVNTIVDAVGKQGHGIYLSSDVFTEHKDFSRYRDLFSASGISIEGRFVSTFADWKREYELAQHASFVILGNNGGINDWNIQEATEFSFQQAKILSVTNYDWMMPYSMFAMSKVPEEQGQWAAQVAISILEGEDPQNIPIIANRRWNIYSNPSLLNKAGISLPRHLLKQSVKIGP